MTTIEELYEAGYKIVKTELAAHFEYEPEGGAYLCTVLPPSNSGDQPIIFAARESYSAQRRAKELAYELGYQGEPAWETEQIRGPGRGNPMITKSGKLTMLVEFTGKWVNARGNQHERPATLIESITMLLDNYKRGLLGKEDLKQRLLEIVAS